LDKLAKSTVSAWVTATGVVVVEVAGAVLDDPPPPQPASNVSGKAHGKANSE
jgi:hypothetical protein